MAAKMRARMAKTRENLRRMGRPERPKADIDDHAMPARQGIAVDAQGGPVVDPTENVRELVEAAINRQDDLRYASEKYLESIVDHVKETILLRAEYQKLIRENDLVVQSKVREVDVLGGRTEAERAQEAIKALAQAGVETAETLRKMVETQASTLAMQLDNKFDESNKRISALELSISEGKGKQTVSDPALMNMMERLDRITAAMNEERGKAAISDPALEKLARRFDLLTETMSENKGKSAINDPAMAIIVEKFERMNTMLSENRGKSEVKDPQIDAMLATVGKLTDALATGKGKSEGMETMWKYLIPAIGGGGVVAGAIKLMGG